MSFPHTLLDQSSSHRVYAIYYMVLLINDVIYIRYFTFIRTVFELSGPKQLDHFFLTGFKFMYLLISLKICIFMFLNDFYKLTRVFKLMLYRFTISESNMESESASQS